ncbi:MAG: PilZ domain-containing protein [Desulfobacteraceae bacterium]|nr:PilZ domain-containing protein [Desulfobacteraceae bacterium]
MLKWLTGKRDKRNGNKPEPVGDVRLSIILAGGELLPCDIEYLDREGGSLSFPGESHLNLSRRERLEFLTDNRSKELIIDAIILKSSTVKGRRVCRFRFADMVNLEEALGSGVLSSFNRRRAFRVAPNAGDKIEIELAWGGEGTSGSLVDISTSGIGITVDSITVDLDPEVGGTLGPLDRLTLSFQLPGCDTWLRMTGIIRNRNPKGKKIRYGIDFEWDQSGESQQQAEAIRGYLMRQQQSVLERSAWTRRG